jgi:cystathionine beta-lyase
LPVKLPGQTRRLIHPPICPTDICNSDFSLAVENNFQYDRQLSFLTRKTMPNLFDFDTPNDRNNTCSVKWDRYKDTDILPMWVADTDFKAPPPVIEALQTRAAQGVFGYTHVPEKLTALVVERMQRLYDWQIKAEWLVWIPGVVGGLNLACRSVGDADSPVMVPSVIYPHFPEAPLQIDRQPLSVPMVKQDNRWVIDLDWMAENLDGQSKLLLFCNPQNPGGSVYRRDELTRLAELAEQQDFVIASDEIHCDLILEPGLKHIPIASLNAEIERRSITLMSASKNFNLAGLSCSFAIIPDQELRQKFKYQSVGIVPHNNLFGYAAMQAAFEHGEDWNRQLVDYLRCNRDFLMREINAIKGLRLDSVEATYLAWIDVSELGLDNPHRFFEQAGVGMSPGKDFGDANFMRLNFGCPRSLLEEAVSRMRDAIDKHWNN